MPRSIVCYNRHNRDNETTQMSTSHWISESVAPRGVTEVPLPLKTSQLPIITLPGRPMSTHPSVVSTLSDPLICSTDEEPYCLSLPIDRPKHSDQLTNCSSSCDDLNLCAPSGVVISDMGRLTKASSDNPVFGTGSPPIPPRDYIPKAQGRPMFEQKLHKPEIHPIVQDGEKRSNTHYWLLPDKQKTSSLDDVDKTGEPQHYVNLAANELWAKKFGISKPLSSRKKTAVGGKAQGRSHHVSDSAVESGHQTNCSPDMVPLLSDISSLDSMSVNIPMDEPEESPVDPLAEDRTTSMGEIKEKIDNVQSKIDGVTFDESFTALAMNHWNVEIAVEYLKVENLFRLGLASRERCRRFLEVNGWDQERAASGLLDLMSTDSSNRK